ncbi:hypothetical protein ACKAV7_008421 [Fusarium commune]
MRATTLFSHGLFASGALAGCYSGGSSFDTVGRARVLELVDSFCEQGIILSPVPVSKSRCYNIGNGKSVTYQFNNLMPNLSLVGKDDCKNSLRSMVSQCRNGGETEYTKVKVKVDPNDQACG